MSAAREAAPVTLVLRVPAGLDAAAEDSLLSIAAQEPPPDRLVIVPDGLAAPAAASLAELLDAFRPLLPGTRAQLAEDAAFASALLRIASEESGRNGIVSVLRSGDALFGHWMTTVREAMRDAPAAALIRMRFARQPARLATGPGGKAPYATAGLVRPYADRYDPARHREHMQTPASAVAWRARAVQGLAAADPGDARDITWRLLERAAAAGSIAERSEITSLVRAWDDAEWRAFEHDALEPGAAIAPPAEPGPLTRIRRRLGNLRRRG